MNIYEKCEETEYSINDVNMRGLVIPIYLWFFSIINTKR